MRAILKILSILALLVGIYYFVTGEIGFGVIAVVLSFILYPSRGSVKNRRRRSRAKSHGSYTHYSDFDDDDDDDDHDDNGYDDYSGDSDSGGGGDD